jgi:hypothetical protein
MTVMEREAWIDERLDDLATGIDKRFDRVDADIRELRADMNRGFEGIDERFERIDKKFESLDAKVGAKFDSLQGNTLLGFIGLFGSIVGSAIAAVLAAIALG